MEVLEFHREVLRALQVDRYFLMEDRLQIYGQTDYPKMIIFILHLLFLRMMLCKLRLMRQMENFGMGKTIHGIILEILLTEQTLALH